jgi:hypothetical protein
MHVAKCSCRWPAADAVMSLEISEEHLSKNAASAECAKQIGIRWQVGDDVGRFFRFNLEASC